MRATIRDAYHAITWRNCAAFAGAAAILLAITGVFGYVTARRFVNPSLIIGVGFIAWKIARLIKQEGLSRIINAAAVGMFGFGVITFAAGVVDTAVFGPIGHFQFFVNTLMWMWVAFHLLRALSILKRMKPDQLQHITHGTAIIVATMTAVQVDTERVLSEYEKVTGTKLQMVMM